MNRRAFFKAISGVVAGVAASRLVPTWLQPNPIVFEPRYYSVSVTEYIEEVPLHGTSAIEDLLAADMEAAVETWRTLLAIEMFNAGR